MNKQERIASGALLRVQAIRLGFWVDALHAMGCGSAVGVDISAKDARRLLEDLGRVVNAINQEADFLQGRR